MTAWTRLNNVTRRSRSAELPTFFPRPPSPSRSHGSMIQMLDFRFVCFVFALACGTGSATPEMSH